MPPDAPLPTDAELAILRTLWTDGPATVREVQDGLDTDQGYTTVLKHLQIMLEKGLVTRDESGRAHVYAAHRAEADTQRRLVRDLLDRAFGGSARQLVMRVLSTEDVSREELDQIRDLLDQIDDDPDDEA
ncbi:MAG: BlaI/MecI/CopY family transcriptional regulator [Salinibacter sp.]